MKKSLQESWAAADALCDEAAHTREAFFGSCSVLEVQPLCFMRALFPTTRPTACVEDAAMAGDAAES